MTVYLFGSLMLKYPTKLVGKDIEIVGCIMIKSPPILGNGDTIRIVATARHIEQEPVQIAKQMLEARGFKIELGEHVNSDDHYLAGTDDERTHDFQLALDDEHVKAILCARGGYGSVRILDRIDWSNYAANPKWICGFSDITALHHRSHKMGVQSIHSTMPINFAANSEESINSLIQALMGSENVYSWETDLGESMEGVVVGGNLSIIYSMLGSSDQLNTDGKILFIEEVDEHYYHIDRVMMSLKRAGLLSRLSGILVGGFTSMQDSTRPFGRNEREIIAGFARDLNVPVCFDMPTGHFDDNRAIVFGKHAKIESSNGNR